MGIRRAWECLTRKEIFFYGACLGALAWGAAGVFLSGREKPEDFSGLYRELLRALPAGEAAGIVSAGSLSAPRAPEVTALAGSVAVPAPALGSETVAVNRAPAEELCRLPGIGPEIASRIVERRRRRPFARPEDLLEVRGIGEKRLEAIRPLLCFD